MYTYTADGVRHQVIILIVSHYPSWKWAVNDTADVDDAPGAQAASVTKPGCLVWLSCQSL